MSAAGSTAAFSAGAASSPSAEKAVAAACETAIGDLGGPADLAFVFISADHVDDAGLIAERVCDRVGTERVLGCTVETVVGGDREFEGEPAIAVWLARLPGATLPAMHLSFARTPEGGSFVGWPDELADDWPAGSAMLLLGEPFSFPADVLLERLGEDRPGVPVLGGMASAAHQPGGNRLILGRRVFREGAVAVALTGGVRVRTVVSQGCRPIGKPCVITKAERNVILELGGRAPLAIVQEMYPTLSNAEQRMMRSGLHVGRVTDEYREAFQRGDFLVRNVIGVDSQTGAIAIGDYVRPGQTVQFHLRDAASADEDLRALLAHVMPGGARGGLLFTCNGRGTRLFDEPDHDATAVRQALGEIPLAGFFAAGEIGPIGKGNFLHGFTASLALIESA